MLILAHNKNRIELYVDLPKLMERKTEENMNETILKKKVQGTSCTMCAITKYCGTL